MARSKYINTFDTTAEYENYIESAYPEFPNVGYDKQTGKVNIIRTSPNNHVWYGEVVDASQTLPTISLSGTVNRPTLDTLTNMFYLDSWSNAAPTSISINNKSNIKSIKKWTGLNTSAVTSTSQMFMNCSALTSLDLSNLDTSAVTSMSSMFYGCSVLTSLDLSNLNTSAVIGMMYMFNGCRALTSLDLSSWNTSSVETMYYMFNSCSNLASLDLSNWDITSVTNTQNMFTNCNKLTNVYITVEATLMKLTNNLTSQGDSYIPGSATIHYNGIDYKWQNNAWTPQN